MVKNAHLRMGFMALAVTLSAGMVASCGNNDEPVKEKPSNTNNNNTPSKGDPTNTDNDAETDNQDSNSENNSTTNCQEDKNCKPDEVCNSGSCQVNEIAVCHNDGDCTDVYVLPQECITKSYCQGGTCHNEFAASGTSCDDNNGCTSDDKCNDKGECIGTEMVCDAPPADGCDKSNDKYILHGTTGTCEIKDGIPTCVYSENQQECQGNCAANCLAKCGNVTCEQDSSCYEVQCDATLSGEGTDLCTPSVVKKAAGSSCELETAPTPGFCTENGACVACLNNSHCESGFECVYNQCAEIKKQCTDNVCNSTNNKLTKCENGEYTSESTCPYGCNKDGNNCAEAECTKNVCENDILVECKSGYKQEEKRCSTGCNDSKTACNPEKVYTKCDKSVCTGGKMKYCYFDNSVNEYIYSDEIDCNGYQCDNKGESCEFYCTFQWLEEADNGSLNGYALSEIHELGDPDRPLINMTGGGLYCSEAIKGSDNNLSLPAFGEWIKGSNPQLNENSDWPTKKGVNEWMSNNANVKAGVQYFCTFIAEIDAKLTNGGTFKGLQYSCPQSSMDETQQLVPAKVVNGKSILSTEQADTRYITTTAK